MSSTATASKFIDNPPYDYNDDYTPDRNVSLYEEILEAAKQDFAKKINLSDISRLQIPKVTVREFIPKPEPTLLIENPKLIIDGFEIDNPNKKRVKSCLKNYRRLLKLGWSFQNQDDFKNSKIIAKNSNFLFVIPTLLECVEHIVRVEKFEKKVSKKFQLYKFSKRLCVRGLLFSYEIKLNGMFVIAQEFETIKDMYKLVKSLEIYEPVKFCDILVKDKIELIKDDAQNIDNFEVIYKNQKIRVHRTEVKSLLNRLNKGESVQLKLF